jgi:hypothetical protein
MVIPLHWSHPVKNVGDVDLRLFNASDLALDRSAVDSRTRDAITIVIKP